MAISLDITNGRRVGSLERAAQVSGGDALLASMADGTGEKLVTADILKGYAAGDAERGLEALRDALLQPGSGPHNSIYRGKNLGTKVTDEQWAVIKAGTFDDMYIGDYWVIGGVTWRIAAFDYFYNCGDTNCTTHHVTVVPDSCLYNSQMNSTNVTTGGYTGSAMYGTGLASAKSTINSAFGSAHVLKHRQLLTNGVSNGGSSSFAFFDSTVELMNEVMVYGTRAWSQSNGNGYDVASSDGQLPLFAMNHNLIHNRDSWWLMDACSASTFAYVNAAGNADIGYASRSYGVRPTFSIYS